MILNNKAKTLINLKLKKSKIPKLKIYTYKNFLKKPKDILEDISSSFNKNIAIRSCSKSEDQKQKSNAGKFKSFLNINPKNKEEVKNKILEVIKSYKKNLITSEFFIQEMVNNIKISGVILTRDLENFLPCYSINYSEGQNSTIVTSGKDGSKTLIYIKNNKYKLKNIFSKLINSTKEIEEKTKLQDLDIEFIINKNNEIVILQVRKLIIPKKFLKIRVNQLKLFNNLEKKIKKLKLKNHNLHGETTYFGVMPDWNPAEIIGIKPRPLALSLYQELITDHVWSQNRKMYGYKDLSQFRLMTTFYGTPFVDVRIDFNSWIPDNLDKNISQKLVNYYLKTFKKNKHFHDKVEFEILYTCLTLSSEIKIKNKLKNVLTKNEQIAFINSLKKINLNALKNIDNDVISIKELIKRQKIIEKSNLYYIDKIYWLVEDCKKYGTLPFANIARCAFISSEILNSFVEQKIINTNEKIKFLSSIKTITRELTEDLNKNKKKFLKKYGHLRPGTYEITSGNYKSEFKNYFGSISKNKISKVKHFVFTKRQKKLINQFILKNKIYKNFGDLISFIKKSIKLREYSKFVFTKNIDLIFDNLQRFGKKFNIKIDDLSYIKIHKILDLYFNLSNFKSIENLKTHIKDNKIEYLNNKYINLPQVILEPADLFIQRNNEVKINFISNKKITSKIITLNISKIKNKINYFNGIVCIENADPGYDFLFTKNIKGLVTKFGGQNSHMAIRCAELNLPAIIGVGENLYNRIINTNNLCIDCVSKKIEFIN
jgi:hypothetical protein